MNGFKVLIVGPSASGKSTAGRGVASGKSDICWVEASRDLIERREYDQRAEFAAERSRGLAYFRAASEREGKAWAAQRVLRYVDKKNNAVVTGIRGAENVQALRSAGFFCLYLACSGDALVDRLVRREGISETTARQHLREEEQAYDFQAIRAEADFILDTERMTPSELIGAAVNICMTASEQADTGINADTCVNCANPRNNPAVFANDATLCEVCKSYWRYGPDPRDEGRLAEVFEDISASGAKALLGMSGGKDSTAAAIALRRRGVPFSTFTVDMGYYPLTMLGRAKDAASKLGVQHSIVDGRQFISRDLAQCYTETARLFAEVERSASKGFIVRYLDSRCHYSTKDTRAMAHPRVCVLCRKAVIRAYYDVASRTGARYIFLGMNEWASLSASATGVDTRPYSGFRRIAVDGRKPVFLIHLPYILKSTLSRNSHVLRDAGWKVPFGEQLVETNANSCLLAKATESIFLRYAGFHPDSTRLSREVLVGFLRRADALRALSRISFLPWTASEVLSYAKIKV